MFRINRRVWALVLVLSLLTLFMVLAAAPAAPATITVPYSTAPVTNADLDGNPATGAWSDASNWTIPLENGASAPYGSAQLYAKHNGSYIFFRIDGHSDVPWQSASGTHFWLGMQISPSGTSHHSSGTWEGVFFGLWDGNHYSPAPTYPPSAVETNGFGQPPTQNATQSDYGRMAYSGSAAPYAFTAEWKRPLTAGGLTLVPDGSTSYHFFVTTDSAGAGSNGGNLNHGSVTNVNVMRLAAVGGGDTVPPTVSITSPANGAVVNGIVTVTATATDNVGVTRVEFYADTTLLGTVTTPPYAHSWDTTPFVNGAHQLVAKAYDAANNVGTSTISVTVNHSARTVYITSPSDRSVLKGIVIIKANATDPGGVSGVAFFADATALGSTTTPPYAHTWDTSAFAEGLRVVRATASFTTGGTLNATINVIVDRTPPHAVAGPAITIPAGRTVTFNGSNSSDANGISNWTWTFNDSRAQRLFGVAPSYRFAAVGDYRVNLTAADPAGNLGTDSTWVNVTVPDTTPPPRLDAPTVSTAGVGSTRVTWTASSASDLDGYFVLRSNASTGPFVQLNANPLRNTTYVDQGLVPGGTYFYEVVAVDLSGNPSRPSPPGSGVAGDTASSLLDLQTLRWAALPAGMTLVLVLLALLVRREMRRRWEAPMASAEDGHSDSRGDEDL